MVPLSCVSADTMPKVYGRVAPEIWINAQFEGNFEKSKCTNIEVRRCVNMFGPIWPLQWEVTTGIQYVVCFHIRDTVVTVEQ